MDGNCLRFNLPNKDLQINKTERGFSLTDNVGNSYLFVWTWYRWFNIAKCEVNTDGHIDDNDGLVPDAIPFHPEEVAYLLSEADERAQQLERVESLLEEWISLRRSKSRRVKQGGRLQRLQNKEVAK